MKKGSKASVWIPLTTRRQHGSLAAAEDDVCSAGDDDEGDTEEKNKTVSESLWKFQDVDVLLSSPLPPPPSDAKRPEVSAGPEMIPGYPKFPPWR